MDLPSASTGRGGEAARAPTETPTSALDVEVLPMGPAHALSLRRNLPLTPLDPYNWHSSLSSAGLLSRYPFIVNGIRFGFNIGIPRIHKTFTPPNSPSIDLHRSEFQRMVKKEFDAGHYIGPFSKTELENLLGPFQTSPLSLIPKPHSDTNELRIIQNFSFPRSPSHTHFSINYFISSNEFPCTWGTFNAMCLKVSLLPPGSEGGIRDVSEAYRLVRTHHSQWPGTVVRIDEDQFAADTYVAFGETSGSGAYGVIADASADIYRAHGIGPLSKWVDDHCFLRILLKFLSEYNNLREVYRKQIESHGGMRQSGGRLWW